MSETTPLGALQHAVTSLTRTGRAFALVGGIAVTVRSEVRFTRDVDLAISVDDDRAVKRGEELLFYPQITLMIADFQALPGFAKKQGHFRQVLSICLVSFMDGNS